MFLRHARPETIVESGVHIGLGTWILRQAAPHARLILLDPDWRKEELVYEVRIMRTMMMMMIVVNVQSTSHW